MLLKLISRLLSKFSRQGCRDADCTPQDNGGVASNRFLTSGAKWLSVARAIVSWRSKAVLRPASRYVEMYLGLGSKD